MGCQIVSVLVLSRLLTPEDFGLVVMCSPVVAFLGMFQSLGLLQATVQRPSIDHAQVNFLFWVNVAASTVIALLLVALAAPVAAFYDEPRVGPLIAAMAIPMLISGSSAQHAALLNRRMEFGRVAAIDVLIAVTTLLTSIAWAIVDPSYWALFAGSVFGALAGVAVTWLWSGWLPTMPRFVANGRDLVSFGAGITGFNLSNFFARNLDSILIGRFWGGVQLGLYDRAYKLLLFPLSQIANPLSRVMVPALSRLASEPERYRKAYLQVVRLTLLISLPGVAWATMMSDSLIPFALGEQWAGSAPIFSALGFAGLVQPLNNPAGWLFISQGRSREFMIWGLWTAAFAVSAFAIGIFWGAVGIAVAYSISEYLKTPFLWRYVGRSGPVGALHIIRATGPFMLAAHLSLAALWLMRAWLPDETIAALILSLLLSYIVSWSVIVMSRSGREAVGDVKQAAFQLVRRDRAAAPAAPQTR